MGCSTAARLALALWSSPFFLSYEDKKNNPGDISNERPMGTFLLVDDNLVFRPIDMFGENL
jgi:hypothetical protein